MYAWFSNTFIYTDTGIHSPSLSLSVSVCVSFGRSWSIPSFQAQLWEREKMIKLTKMYTVHTHSYFVCVWFFFVFHTLFSMLFKKRIDARLKEDLLFFFLALNLQSAENLSMKQQQQKIQRNKTPDNSQHWHHRFQFYFVPSFVSFISIFG